MRPLVKVEGQYSLARMAQERAKSSGSVESKREAKRLLLAAAQKGFSQAQCSLASVYLEELGADDTD